MINVLIINPDGQARMERVQSVYPAINRAMGVEYIQALYTPGLVYYMDEEGKFNDWQDKPNPVAQAVYRQQGGELLPGDYFVGPVAISGTGKAPEDESTPDWFIEEMQAAGMDIQGLR